VLQTPSLSSEFTAFRDETRDPPALVVQVGKTELAYHLCGIEALHAMLKMHGDWMPLGSADEQKPAADGTVEAWARAASNPVGGWYGLEKGLRGRFGNYVPPVLEALGLAEVEHGPRNNRMRAVGRIAMRRGGAILRRSIVVARATAHRDAPYGRQAASSNANARARCEMVCFLSGSISPNVKLAPSGRNIGS
jgi:hypothetical protein